MYESHFGLDRPPFGETVDPSVYVALPTHDTVARRLRYALEHGRGPAVLFGPPGSGKTLLARKLASDLHHQSVHLTFPALSAAELVAYLAQEFGGSTPVPSSPSGALLHLRDRLAALAARGERPLLIVDEAHLIEDSATFEALRLLLNFATTGPPDLSLLFVGGAEVLFQLPTSLTDRLAARCLLGPLTEAESSTYIVGRLSAAGGRTRLFTSDALSELHSLADGLPRRLNHLADLALLIAYAQDHPVAEGRDIAIAAREFERDAAP